MGIKQMVQYATQFMKVAPEKSEMKPRATAITNSEATAPNAGCFMRISFLDLSLTRKRAIAVAAPMHF
jgi:hypothetical protein